MYAVLCGKMKFHSGTLDESMIMNDTLDIVHTKEAEVVTIEEGETVFNRTYVKSVSTEIIMDRTFTIPGYIYNLTLVSFNMHDITAPNIIMRWHVECANPVVAADWSAGGPAPPPSSSPSQS